MKQVPFYANTANNRRCALACYGSIIEYFFDEHLTWDQLDEITGFKDDTAAWTLPTLLYFARRGVKIEMIEPFDYKRYLEEGESYLSRVFSAEELAWQLKNSNIRTMQKDIPEFLKTINHHCANPTLEDVDRLLDDGALLTIVVNSKVLKNEPGYEPHMILAIQKEGNGYTVHDPGLPPRPNLYVSRQLLWRAMGKGNMACDVTAFKFNKVSSED